MCPLLYAVAIAGSLGSLVISLLLDLHVDIRLNLHLRPLIDFARSHMTSGSSPSLRPHFTLGLNHASSSYWLAASGLHHTKNHHHILHHNIPLSASARRRRSTLPSGSPSSAFSKLLTIKCHNLPPSLPLAPLCARCLPFDVAVTRSYARGKYPLPSFTVRRHHGSGQKYDTGLLGIKDLFLHWISRRHSSSNTLFRFCR